MAIETLIANEFVKTGGISAIDLITAASLSLIGIVVIILGLIFLLAWIAISIGGIVLWIWMIVDCLHRKFRKSSEKTIWLIVLIGSIFGSGMLLHVLAALGYYFIVKKSSISIKLNRKTK